MMKLNISRRDVLIAGGLAAGAAALPAPAQANTQAQMEAAIRSVVGQAKINKGKVDARPAAAGRERQHRADGGDGRLRR